MSKQLFGLLAGALAIAALATGCGGSDAAGITTSSLSQAEFIKKADAACEDGDKRTEVDFAAYVEEEKFPEEPTKEQYAELVDTVMVPNVDQELEDIRAIGAPSGDEEQVDAILAAIEGTVERAQDDPEALLKNPDAIFAESSKLAKEYGLEVCGQQ